MSIEIEKKITRNLIGLRRFRGALNSALSTTEILRPSLSVLLDQLRVELESEITAQVMMQKELELDRKRQRQLYVAAKSEELKVIFNPNTTMKSETVDIEKEIERLNSILKSGITNYPVDVEKRIKLFDKELGNRKSGIRRPPRIVQGGNTGLKK